MPVSRLLFLLCACATSNNHRRLGEAALARGRLAEATLELEMAVAGDPGDAGAWAALGRARRAAGAPGAALRALERAARGGVDTPERRELLVARARARAALGEVDRWRDLDEAGRDDPRRATALARELRAALAAAARNRRHAGDEAGALELERRAGAAAAPADVGAWLRGESDDAPETPLLRAAATGPGLEAELARATLARLDGRDDDARAALARARALPGGIDALARRGEWQGLDRDDAASAAVRRFHAILAAGGPGDLGQPGARPLPLRPGCTPDPDALAALHAAVAVDLGRADRRARAYVDGDLPLGCRAPQAYAAFFATSPAHALPWAEALADENPEAAEPPLLEARALAALGNAPRALLALTQAEAFAARRGRASTEIAERLVDAGAVIAAIGAGRQAIALAHGDDRPAAFRALAAACRAAGRDADADRVRAAAPPDARDARALLLIGLADDGARGARALVDYADAMAAAGQAELARAARAEAAALDLTTGARTAPSAACARRTPAP